VPSKASHPNGNGNGHCRIHSDTATACRACLVHGLQEFRFTNLRAGLRIAAKRITALRADYAAKGGAEVKASLVAYELGTLLARLQAADDQVQALPGDAGLITQVMLQAEGNGTVGKPA
jgi:hypothetical protein